MILAFLTRFLPIAYTNSAAGMPASIPEMEEAVRILGGGRLHGLRQVVAPLLKRTLVGRLHPGVHPGLPGAVHRHLPLPARHTR